MSSTIDPGIAPNARRLLWAGFLAILAAGVGFAIRGGILDNWGGEYGFTATQLGVISGAGLTGFCFGIMIGGVIVDKIGYGWLVVLAFVLHVLSAIVTFAASGPENAFTMLYLGSFIFAYANGTLEAVANPLVATLFPHNRTHYLNILHASWPAGLVLGSALGWVLDDRLNWPWKYQLALYMVPTVLYGLMFMGQSFPKSEASAKGLKLGEMFKDVGMLGAAVACFLLGMFFYGDVAPLITGNKSVVLGVIVGVGLWLAVGGMTNFALGSLLLFILFITHALVGAVELGTDNWIQNITGNLFTSEQGKWLFIWTSSIMFGLRFAAHFIEKNLGLSPVGILLVCSILAVVGLQLASGMQTFAMALIALGVYAVGKTFFWPTMLAVVSDRYPRTGAIAISIMGGIGMLSAGMIGGPGLGYAKDRFAAEALEESRPDLYATVQSAEPSKFLIFKGVNAIDGKTLEEANKAENPTTDQLAISESGQAGDRKTLKADSAIPATMAVIYLLILVYFQSIGGYKPVTIDETPGEREAAELAEAAATTGES